MVLEPLKVLAFETMTGQFIGNIPYTNVVWKKSLNEAGTIDITVDWSREAATWDIRGKTWPWRTLIAVIRGDTILHAGPVVNRSRPRGSLTIPASGMWEIFKHRLVLNYALSSKKVDGQVMIDEDNPAPEWKLELTGSLVDIAVKLVAESLKWGALPITLPPLTGGPNVRVYYGFDLASVDTRLSQLTEVIGGPELRFEPRIGVDGRLSFAMQGSAELIDTVHQWNEIAPGQRVSLASMHEDGSAMTTDHWGLGGGSDDMVLMTRASSDALTRVGWPVMQSADTSHSSVSELPTLRGYVQESLLRGSQTQEVFSLQVGAEQNVKPGDWADLTVEDFYLGHTVLPLKILEVSGDTSDWLTVNARVRNGL
ncbi:hypothetical protein [Lysinibacter cavernae]|uniref:Minor tail protein n=1 Tax=Lysinibacter cavernae TaxID=1640652 RepID=A0A7X5TSS9_9MICO|nr:hypothetical protein [Lysinibacter cavernae]NIH52553.1 hypothetical protein [Lysinibacter cavernae]